MIIFTSIFVCVFFLILENLSGIHWDFHPDAVTYTTTSFEMVNAIIENGDFIGIFNNFYYFISAAMYQEKYLLISINIITFSYTNFKIEKFCKKIIPHFTLKKINITSFFVWTILFMPYRLHLSVHVLKDTLIIFALISFWLSINKIKAMNFLLLISIRIFSILYLLLFFNNKYMAYFILIFTTGLILGGNDTILYIESKNDVDMTFRDFDLVPNFIEYGLMGTVFRFITWPFLAFTGFYLLISPSIAYAPLALGTLIMNCISFRFLRLFVITAQAYIVLGIIAVVTTGFTSYIRYCFPVLVMLPLFLLKNHFHDYEKN